MVKYWKHIKIYNKLWFNVVDTSFCCTPVVDKCSVSILLIQALVCNCSITLLGLIIQTIRSNFHLSRPTKEKELLSESGGCFYVSEGGVWLTFIKSKDIWYGIEALLTFIIYEIIHKRCEHIIKNNCCNSCWFQRVYEHWLQYSNQNIFANIIHT